MLLRHQLPTCKVGDTLVELPELCADFKNREDIDSLGGAIASALEGLKLVANAEYDVEAGLAHIWFTEPIAVRDLHREMLPVDQLLLGVTERWFDDNKPELKEAEA